MKVRYSFLAAVCLSCLSLSALASEEFTIIGTQEVSTVTGSISVEFAWKFRFYGDDGVELLDVTPKLASEQTLPGYVVDETGVYPVRRIGDSALANSPALTSVKLSVQTTEIGDYVFANCPVLSSVELNNGLRSIGRAPFLNTIVTSINLPNTVIEMSGNVGAGALFTTKVNIGDSSHFVTTDDGCIYNKDKTRLYSCPGRASGTVTLPASLTEIMADAFFGCFDLTYLNIPANVKTIGSKAFNVNGIWSNLSAPESTPKLETVFYQGEKPIADAANDIYEGAPETLTSYAFTSSWTEGTWKGRPLKVAKGASSPILKSTVNGIEWSFRIVDNAYAEIYNNGKAAIPTATEYTDEGYRSSKTIFVPTSLYGYPVNAIGQGAFRNCNVFAEVVVPSTVSSIGDNAFEGCTAMRYLEQEWASRQAGVIQIPEGIETLGYRVFQNDNKIQKLVLPATLTSISNNPIAGCKFISEIEVAESNTRFAYAEPLLFDAAKTRLIACLPTVTAVTVPETVKTLGAESFDGCELLESVVFPGDAPESAPTNLFAGLSPKLTVYANVSEKASWAAAITNEPWKSLVEADRFVDTGAGAMTPTIEDDNGNSWTFFITNGVAEVVSLKPAADSALLSVTLPANVGRYVVKTIANGALANLRGLTSVSIPSTYEEIGDYVFSNCTSLAAITISTSVRRLGKAPFYGTAITSLSLPASLTQIDGNPLVGCAFAGSITVDSGNLSFFAENGLLFGYDTVSTNLVACVPSATSATLPASLTKIERDAFAGCSRLTSVVARGNEPAADEGIFDGTPANLVVSADAYVFNWGDPVPTSWKGRKFENTGKASPSGIKTYTDASGVTWTYTVTADRKAVLGETDVAIGSLTQGEVSIPAEVDGWPLVKVGPSAFRNCSLVTKITISASVTNIADTAFLGCASLTAFGVADGNPFYSARNGALYSNDGTTLVKVPAGFRFATAVTAVKGGTSQSVVEVVNGFDQNLQPIPNSTNVESTAALPVSTTVTTFLPETSGKTLTSGVKTIAAGAFADCGYLPVGTTTRGTVTVTTDGTVVSTQSGEITLSVGTDSTNTTQTTATTTRAGVIGSKVATWITVQTVTEDFSASVAKPDLTGISYDAATVWKDSFWEGQSSAADTGRDEREDTDKPISRGDVFSLRGGVQQVLATGLDGTVVKSVTASGLPTGVKLVKGSDPATGITTWTIQGVPTKAATKAVTLTVTNWDKTKEKITFTIRTQAAPAWLVGEFNGPVFASATSEDVDGYATAKVTSAGKATGKLQLPSDDGTKAKTYSFTLKNFTGYDEATSCYSGTAVVTVGTQKREVEIRCRPADDGTQTGTLTADLGKYGFAELYQNIWKRTDLAAPRLTVGQTVTYEGLSLKVQSKGKVKWSGTLTGDDGKAVKVSGSSQLLNDGRTTVIYAAPKKNLVYGRAGVIEL